MIRDAVTALFGLAGFGLLGCVSPTIVGQALNTLLALGLIGAAYIVWTVWGQIANLVDFDQVNPLEIDRVSKKSACRSGNSSQAQGKKFHHQYTTKRRKRQGVHHEKKNLY